jgi:hypothetical protein
MTLCLVILVGYAFQTVGRKIIRLNLVLLAISFGISCLWLILYLGALWAPRTNYDYPISTANYLRLSIILLFMAQLLKLLLIYYYLTQMQIN